MKVYISHDALQIGIYTVDAKVFEDEETIKFIQEGSYRLLYKPSWSDNLEDAMKNAIALKEYVIEDLKYKIEQLENYEIQVIDVYEQIQTQNK